MTKIEADCKFDFNNVLIRPQRSTINSRSSIDLTRQISFKYSSKKWQGIPIIAANMDTTGTFGVYEVLSKHQMITSMNKFYTINDYRSYVTEHELNPDYFMVSTGIGDGALEKIKEIFDEIPCSWLCIDIANGYISNFVEFCAEARKLFPDKIICAGNVVSGAMAQEIVLHGKVDVVKLDHNSSLVHKATELYESRKYYNKKTGECLSPTDCILLQFAIEKSCALVTADKALIDATIKNGGEVFNPREI